jgi:chloramphenicol-sensitive protein RarD
MTDESRRGFWAAIGAYLAWGVFPIYWRWLHEVPALQILTHRIAWCFVFVAGYLAVARGIAWWRPLLAQPLLLRLLATSAVLISLNWWLYIWAVNAGHVVETSLGYFINPLLNVVLGVLLLRERLSVAQWVSVAVAAAGVLWLTFNYGSFPWIALSLAASFGFYGFIRKLAVVDSIPGLAIESLYLFLPAVAALAWVEMHGNGGFVGSWGWQVDALLVFGGALTAVPLIGFSYAVRRVPYSVIGFMQYIAPTLQLLIGVLVFGEVFDRARAIGFGFIWIGLLIFAVDGVWRSRRKPACLPVAEGLE